MYFTDDNSFNSIIPVLITFAQAESVFTESIPSVSELCPAEFSSNLPQHTSLEVSIPRKTLISSYSKKPKRLKGQARLNLDSYMRFMTVATVPRTQLVTPSSRSMAIIVCIMFVLQAQQPKSDSLIWRDWFITEGDVLKEKVAEVLPGAFRCTCEDFHENLPFITARYHLHA